MTDPYNDTVLKYFSQPLHSGDVVDGMIGYVNDQGMRIRLSARVDDDIITEMRFRAWGCPHVIAAAELVCRQFEGRSSGGLEDFQVAQIMSELGVPIEKTGRILVLEDTVRSLGQAIQDRASRKRQ